MSADLHCRLFVRVCVRRVIIYGLSPFVFLPTQLTAVVLEAENSQSISTSGSNAEGTGIKITTRSNSNLHIISLQSELEIAALEHDFLLMAVITEFFFESTGRSYLPCICWLEQQSVREKGTQCWLSVSFIIVI